MDANQFEIDKILLSLDKLRERWEKISSEPWPLANKDTSLWYREYRRTRELLSGYESPDFEKTSESNMKRLYAVSLEKIKRLQKEVRHQQEVLEAKNLHLQTLHFIWCSGCAAHHDHTLTQEMVLNAVHQTSRMVISWINAAHRNPSRGSITLDANENDGGLLGSYLYELYSESSWKALPKDQREPWLKLASKLMAEVKNTKDVLNG